MRVEKEPTETPPDTFAEPEWTLLFCAQVRMSHDAQERIAEAIDKLLLPNQRRFQSVAAQPTFPATLHPLPKPVISSLRLAGSL
jgi:hypothetical protein